MKGLKLSVGVREDVEDVSREKVSAQWMRGEELGVGVREDV